MIIFLLVLIHTNDQLKNFYLKCQKHEIIAVDTEFYRVEHILS